MNIEPYKGHCSKFHDFFYWKKQCHKIVYCIVTRATKYIDFLYQTHCRTNIYFTNIRRILD